MKTVTETPEAALRGTRSLFISLGVFSCFVNILMLTGPLYMLQVYDRVLSSRSESTLVALTVLIAALYGIMGVLDYARGRIAARVGALIQTRLDPKVFEAGLSRALVSGERGRPWSGLRDLEAVQRFMASPVLFALFDIPWTPIFLFAIFTFHPLLGWLAVGGSVLLVVDLARQPDDDQALDRRGDRDHAGLGRLRRDGPPAGRGGEGPRHAAGGARALAEEPQPGAARQPRLRRRGEPVHHAVEDAALLPAVGDARRRRLHRAAGRDDPGLDDRRLDPARPRAGAGRAADRRLAAGRPRPPGLGLAQDLDGEGARGRARFTTLPAPRPRLELTGVTVVPPDQQRPSLRAVSFKLAPGQALGVIGPSASGKSTLARTLDRHLAARRRRGAPRRRRARALRPRPRPLHRLPAPGHRAVRRHRRREHRPHGRAARPRGGGRRGEEGRRARHDPAAARRLRHPDPRRRRRGSPAASASASRSPARSTATRRSWCSTSRTRTSTARAARR